jgi:hypothetical protein
MPDRSVFSGPALYPSPQPPWRAQIHVPCIGFVSSRIPGSAVPFHWQVGVGYPGYIPFSQGSHMYRPGLQSSTGNGHGVLLKRLASSKKHTLVLCFDVVSYKPSSRWFCRHRKLWLLQSVIDSTQRHNAKARVSSVAILYLRRCSSKGCHLYYYYASAHCSLLFMQQTALAVSCAVEQHNIPPKC